MKQLIFIFLLLPFISHAQLIRLQLIADPAPAHIAVTGSFSSFTTNSGTASTAQTVTVSGFSLTANCTITWPTGFEGSLNGTSYASTQTITQSGGTLVGQPVTVYTRVAASATAGSYSGNVSFASTGISTVNVPVTATVTNLQIAIFNFSSSSSTVAGATNFFGNPAGSLSFTDAGTGWTLTSIGANWPTYGGYYGGVGNGATAASSDGTFTQVQGNSNYFTENAFNGSNWSLEFTNLPAGTYQIILWASIPSSTFNNGGQSELWVQFGTGSNNYALIDPNAGTSSTGNLQTNGPGTTNVNSGSFTGTITSGQTINIDVSKGTGGAFQTGAYGQLGFINTLKITKIN